MTIDATADTVNNALEVNSSGVTLRELTIQADEGAVEVLSGSIRVIDAALSSYGTDGSGGLSLRNGTAADLTNTDVSFVTSEDCFSGAIVVAGTLTMTGGTVIHQCNRTTSAAICTSGTVDLTGVTVTTNFAKALWTTSGASVSIKNSTLTSPAGEHTIALDFPIHTGSRIINISGTTLNGATMAGKYNLFCQDNNSVTSGGGNTVNGNSTSGCSISGIWP